MQDAVMKILKWITTENLLSGYAVSDYDLLSRYYWRAPRVCVHVYLAIVMVIVDSNGR